MAEIPHHLQGDVPEFHRLVGLAIRTWADIETTIHSIVGFFLDVDQFRARIVMGSIVGSRAKREFLTRLAETYLDPTMLPKFRNLMGRMKSLSRTRNSLAHGTMHVNVDGTQNMVFADTFSQAMDGGLDFEARQLPLNDLRVFVAAVQKLHDELMYFPFECDGRIFRDARIHREEAARRARPTGEDTSTK